MTSPKIGRIVHYRCFGTPGGEYVSACRAAIVTENSIVGGDDKIGIAVINPTGIFFDRSVPEDDNAEAGGTWHWPCVRQ